MRSISRYGLFLLSAFVLIGALSVYTLRKAGAQRATELLNLTFRADKELTYSAVSSVDAVYGSKTVTSTARTIRTPGKLSINYVSGASKGLESGYNQHYFWRRERAGAPLCAYAVVKWPPEKMAERRFALLLKNYRGYLVGEDTINGLTSEIVELRPRVHVDGAVGPIKRLWIDRASGLTLRNDVFNYQRQLVMKSVLSDIDFHPAITASTFATPGDIDVAARKNGWTAEEMGDDLKGVERATAIRISTPGYLPAGFEFDGAGVHRCKGATKAALVRYTDGLNSLTLFAMLPSVRTSEYAAGEKRGSCDFGSGTMVMATKNGLHALAVGDLPAVTLRRVLDRTDVQRIHSTP